MDLRADNHPCDTNFVWVTIGELERELWWEVDSPVWFVLRLIWSPADARWGEMTSRFEQHGPPSAQEFGS